MDKNDHLNLSLHIPEERISVVIGNKGKTKNEICRKCNVKIEIESKTGEITVSSTSNNFDEYGALKARDIITAISSGFSPERAFRILDEETLFQILDLRNFTSSTNSTYRIKGRIIGEKGKARKNLEELTMGAAPSVSTTTSSACSACPRRSEAAPAQRVPRMRKRDPPACLRTMGR